jgi:hypothetical protein
MRLKDSSRVREIKIHTYLVEEACGRGGGEGGALLEGEMGEGILGCRGGSGASGTSDSSGSVGGSGGCASGRGSVGGCECGCGGRGDVVCIPLGYSVPQPGEESLIMRVVHLFFLKNSQ